MSVMVLRVRSDEITPSLHELREEMGVARLLNAIGPTAAQLTREHLRSKPGNKRGWPSTRFWTRAARATSHARTTNSVVISINQIGVRQRYHGGPILPVKAKALTIPISSKSYGRKVKDFPDAFLLKTKKGAYIVRRGEQISEKTGRIKRGAGKGRPAKRVSAFLEFLFKLSFGVNQEADPTVLPAEAELHAAVETRVQSIWDRMRQA